MIVEREREIQKFESASFFKVIGSFVGDAKKEFKAELSKDLPTGEDAKKFLESCKDAKYTIENVEAAEDSTRTELDSHAGTCVLGDNALIVQD